MRKIAFFAVALLVLSCTSEVKPTWVEEFDGDAVNTEVWSRIPRGASEWQKHMSDKVDALVEVRDGMLHLRGIVNPGIEGEGDVPLLTGGIWTVGKKSFGYGRIDIRAKIGGAHGAWPALWMMPVTGNDPDENDPFWDQFYSGTWKLGKYAEIDICEKLNYDNYAYQTIHSTYTLAAQDKHLDGQIATHGATGAINPADFNVYSVEHYRDSIKLFINDVNTLTYVKTTDKEELEQIPARAQWTFDREFSLYMDMQVGGPWPGEPLLEDLPIEMIIDWVKFYEFK